MCESSVNDFVGLYLHQKKITISSLTDWYKRIKPLAHPDCDSNIYSEVGVEYFLMRLPVEIIQSEKILITANQKILNKYKNLQDYRQVFAHKRKRLYFYSKKQITLVIGINSISDLHDIVPILTGLLIEARKLSFLLSRNVKIFNCFSRKHLTKLSEHYGLSVEDLLNHIECLSKIADFKVELVDCEEP